MSQQQTQLPKKSALISLDSYKYYPLDLEPIFNFATTNLQRLIRKNVRVLMALEEKKRQGTYKPIISKEELDRIKIGLSVGLNNANGSSGVNSRQRSPNISKHARVNSENKITNVDLNKLEFSKLENKTRGSEGTSPSVYDKQLKLGEQQFFTKDFSLVQPQTDLEFKKQLQQNNIEDAQFQLDSRFDQLGELPDFKIDSDRPKKEIDSSYRNFVTNQIKIQQNLLQTINKDEITKQMEQLCKDFLHAIVRSKSYDIKMSMIDIINLPKDENGQPSQNIIKERQASKFTMSLYQDEIDELKMRVGELRSDKEKYLSKFIQAKDQNKELHQVISSMRATYTKELQNLRDALVHKQKDKNYQYTEVRFFDTTETMDEGTKAMLNMKISDVQRMYEDQIKQQQDKLDVFQRQIIMFEKLCEDGNMLVSLDELNAFDISKKLAIVEKDPKILWKALESVFGFGFFHPTIEEEFGITPAFKEQITKQYNEELNKARYETQAKVNKFANSVKNELDIFRRIIGKKNQELSLTHTQQSNKFDNTLNEAKLLMEFAYQNQLEIQTRHLRDKCGKLEETLSDKDIALSQISSETQQLNQKLMNMSKQFKRTTLITDLKLQNNTLQDKYTTEIRVNAALKLKCQQMESSNNYQKHSINQQQVLIEQFSNSLQDTQTKLRIQDSEFSVKVTAYDEQRYYILLLEKELDRLNTMFKRMASQNSSFVFFQQNPIQGLEQLRLKVKNETNNKTQKTIGRVLKDHCREKFAQTDMMDLRKEIIHKPFSITDPDFKIVQTIDIGCQNGEEQISHKIQTDSIQVQTVELMTELDIEHIDKLEQENKQFLEKQARRQAQFEAKMKNMKEGGQQRYPINKKRKHRQKDSNGSMFKDQSNSLNQGISNNQSMQKKDDLIEHSSQVYDINSDESYYEGIEGQIENQQQQNISQDAFDNIDNQAESRRHMNQSQINGSAQTNNHSNNQQNPTQVNFQHQLLNMFSQNFLPNNNNNSQFMNQNDGSGLITSGDVYLNSQNNLTLDQTSEYILHQLLIRKGIDPLMLDYLTNEDFKQNFRKLNKSVGKQGASVNQLRLSQTGGVQINVQPKYEIVSFNLRCLEKSLNKKLGLNNQHKCIQTDPIKSSNEENNDNETSIKTMEPNTAVNFKAHKRLLNHSQVYTKNHNNYISINDNSKTRKQTVFTQNQRKLHDSTSIIDRQNNQTQNLQNDESFSQVIDKFNKTSLGQFSGKINQQQQQPRYKKRNQSIYTSSIGLPGGIIEDQHHQQQLSEERIINESKYTQNKSSKFQEQIKQKNERIQLSLGNGNQKQSIKVNNQDNNSYNNTLIINNKRRQKSSDVFSVTTTSHHKSRIQTAIGQSRNNLNVSQSKETQNRNRRDVQKILLQQYITANNALHSNSDSLNDLGNDRESHRNSNSQVQTQNNHNDYIERNKLNNKTQKGNNSSSNKINIINKLINNGIKQ
eukprot:403345701